MREIERGLRLLAENKIYCVIVGGVAAGAHGSSHGTSDVDACYARDPENLKKLAEALRSVHATLRGAPKDIPFILDDETLRRGLNFTFETDIGDLDLLGEVRGVGRYEECLENAVTIDLFGHSFQVLSLEKLIAAKRTAGRTKDLLVLPELEAILEYEKASEANPSRANRSDDETES